MNKAKFGTHSLKIHIGCGNDYRAGWINIDIDTNLKADFYCDFTQ